MATTKAIDVPTSDDGSVRPARVSFICTGGLGFGGSFGEGFLVLGGGFALASGPAPVHADVVRFRWVEVDEGPEVGGVVHGTASPKRGKGRQKRGEINGLLGRLVGR